MGTVPAPVPKRRDANRLTQLLVCTCKLQCGVLMAYDESLISSRLQPKFILPTTARQLCLGPRLRNCISVAGTDYFYY